MTDVARAPRALVCVDDPSLGFAIGVMIERNGFQDMRATWAAQAVRSARIFRPDVIVIDVTLTGAQGLQAVGALRSASPGTAVVVLSPFPALRAAALAAGALELVELRDLRRLEVCLQHVLAAHPDACECLLGLPEPTTRDRPIRD